MLFDIDIVDLHSSRMCGTFGTCSSELAAPKQLGSITVGVYFSNV